MNAAALRRVRAALRERWQEAVSTAVVAALCLFAHRGLLVFDPYALTALGPSDAGEIFFAPEAGTPGVVLALVAVVISVRLARIDARTPSYASTAGSGVLLLFGSGLCVWGAATTSSFVLAVALASVTLGLGGWLFGSAGHRTLWIPTMMLLLAAPMPPNLVNPVIYPLQLATTNAAAILLSGIGYPTVVTGDLIWVAGRAVEVIESCSGYRAIGTLSLAALFYAGVFPRRTARTLLLLGAAPLVAFSVNAVRVASLALDPESNIEEVHLVQGLLVFGAGSLALGGIDRLLGRLLPEPDSAGAVTTEAGREVTAGEPVALRWGMAGGLLALLALATWRVVPWQPEPRADWRMFELPVEIGRWRAGTLPTDRVFFGTARFSDSVHRRYTDRGGYSVDLFAVCDDRMLPHTGLLSAKLVLPARGWEVVSRRTAGYRLGGRPVELIEISREQQHALVALVRIGLEPLGVELARSALQLDRGPFRRTNRAVVLRITAPLSSNWRSHFRAEAGIRRFARRLEREIRRLDARYTAIRAAGERR